MWDLGIRALDKRSLGHLALGAMLALSAFGCHRTFSASTYQPNPLSAPLESLRQTEELTIITGDMELTHPRPARVEGQDSLMSSERYPLRNTASFTVVSRDRLRFHVQFEHKWKDYTKIHTWKAVLTDDRGRRFAPSSIDAVKAKHLVKTWSFERRTTQRNGFGDIVQINDDGYKDRQPLGSLSVFRGRGDFVFYSRDIFGPEVRWMTLELTRSGVTFRYTWKFADDPPSGSVATR